MTAPNLPDDARSWHRPDITGLRSLAIIPVVAFHAGIPFIPGGFVGVDVFYAISGFLITTLLVRDAAAGRLHLGKFWTRRLRRLLPASVVMIAVTLVAALILYSPLRWAELGLQALSALFYSSNFAFAFQQTDYFANAIAITSPFIHTWSLGVEEQFYLIWPVIILIIAALARKSKMGLRFWLFWVFGILAAASFLVSVIWSTQEPNFAFYLLPSRVWEFAVAGIVALVFPSLALPRWTRTLVGVVGFVVLIGSLFLINSGMPFPGKVAVFPVAGTLLLILAGPRNSSELPSIPARILSLRPLVWIGDVSYSWYLWHWPFIVLVPLIFNNASLPVTIGAAVVSLGVAVLSYRFLENPVRFHPRLVKSMALTLVVSLLAVAPVSAASGAAIWAGDHAGTPVIDGVRVDLNAARNQTSQDPCHRTSTLPSGTSICESGDLSSSTVMLLIGDSHASHWVAAFSAAAADEHVRLVFYSRAGCPVVAVAISSAGEGEGTNTGCDAYRRQALSLITELKPQSVVVSQTDGYFTKILSPAGKPISQAAQLDEWDAAYNKLLDEYTPLVGRVSVILDNPRLLTDPNDCLARPGATFAGCSEPLSADLAPNAPLHQSTVKLLAARNITTMDAAALVCKNGVCPVYANGVLVWRDTSHLTRRWVLTQVPAVRQFVVQATKP